MDLAKLRARIEEHEGRRHRMYRDSRGIATVGIGFNLTRGDAPAKLNQVGADWDKVLIGKESLSDAQVEKLLDLCLDEAIADAAWLVHKWGTLPETVQLVMVDLAFNLGRGKLETFRRFLRAINDRDWKTAAAELVASKWYHQTGVRARKLVAELAAV